MPDEDNNFGGSIVLEIDGVTCNPRIAQGKNEAGSISATTPPNPVSLYATHQPSPSFCWSSFNPSSSCNSKLLDCYLCASHVFFCWDCGFLLSLISITLMVTYKPPQAHSHDMVFKFYLSIQQLLQFSLSGFTSYNYD